MSEIRATTISDAAGTGPIALTGQSAAKAWVKYNQSTPQVDDSQGVSSVTDNSTGDFTITFSSAFDNANYSRSGFCESGGAFTVIFQDAGSEATTTTIRYQTQTSGGTAIDRSQSCGTMHGDLA